MSSHELRKLLFLLPMLQAFFAFMRTGPPGCRGNVGKSPRTFSTPGRTLKWGPPIDDRYASPRTHFSSTHGVTEKNFYVHNFTEYIENQYDTCSDTSEHLLYRLKQNRVGSRCFQWFLLLYCSNHENLNWGGSHVNTLCTIWIAQRGSICIDC